MPTFQRGETVYILNSHRSRAHAGIVLSADNQFVTVHNLDKDDGPYTFHAESGEAAGDYERVSGGLPARVVPVDDPEALALREPTEALLVSTRHYNNVVQAAAGLKREPTRENYGILLQQVREWGDELT